MAAKKTEKTVQDGAISVDIAVNFSGNLFAKKVFINDVQLNFVGGVAHVSVKKDANCQVHWQVAGFVGAKWSYTITCESDAFAIDPKKLSSPGKSFTLKSAFEEPAIETFKVTDAQE